MRIFLHMLLFQFFVHRTPPKGNDVRNYFTRDSSGLKESTFFGSCFLAEKPPLASQLCVLCLLLYSIFKGLLHTTKKGHVGSSISRALK